MGKQLIGCGAFRAEIPLADRTFGIALDRNQLPILVINKLPAADAAIGTNGACGFCVVDASMHRLRFVRHRFQTGAVFAFTDLPNEWPFRKQRQHILLFFAAGAKFSRLKMSWCGKPGEEKPMSSYVRADGELIGSPRVRDAFHDFLDRPRMGRTESSAVQLVCGRELRPTTF